ncbi:hypothetical protein ScPMuIL_017958 [Solemya velum]
MSLKKFNTGSEWAVTGLSTPGLEDQLIMSDSAQKEKSPKEQVNKNNPSENSLKLPTDEVKAIIAKSSKPTEMNRVPIFRSKAELKELELEGDDVKDKDS